MDALTPEPEVMKTYLWSDILKQDYCVLKQNSAPQPPSIWYYVKVCMLEFVEGGAKFSTGPLPSLSPAPFRKRKQLGWHFWLGTTTQP